MEKLRFISDLSKIKKEIKKNKQDILKEMLNALGRFANVSRI